MASKHTRSQHFLWEQQRLRESSDSKHAARINNDRERFYNQRDAAAARQKPRLSNQDIEARADFAMSTAPLIWVLFKWFIAFLLWHMSMGLFAGGFGSLFGGPGAFGSWTVTVIFLALTIFKQVRRSRKRRGY